jgi:hypothetical protein
MAFSPPLTFDFLDAGYAPPSIPIFGDFNPAGVTQQVSPTGITGEFGTPTAATRQTVAALGFSADEFGDAELANLAREIYPSGWQSSALGRPLANPRFDQSQLVPGIAGALGRPAVVRVLRFTFGGAGGYAPVQPLQFDFLLGETVQAAYPPGLIYTEFGFPSVGLNDSEAQPPGFDALEFPSPTVDLAIRLVQPFGIFELAFGATDVRSGQSFALSLGFDASAYGTANVQNFVRFLQPAGFVATTYGTALMELGAAGVFPEGWDSLAIGEHAIDYYLALLAPEGIGELEFGDTFVADAIRLLRAEPPPNATFGDAFISNRVRTVNPLGFRTDDFGTPAASFGIELLPFGFEPLAFGTALVKDDVQQAIPAPITGQFGLGTVRRQFEFVRPAPINQGAQWGDVDVFNRLQQVSVFWPLDHVAGPVSAPIVTLKDRQAFPFGFDALRFPFLGPSVQLGPPPIQAGAGVQTQFGQTLIADRVRTVFALGARHDQVNTPIVLNLALNFTPTPFDAALYGQPSVVNLWQFLPRVWVPEDLAFGSPFVAFGVRTLAPQGFFDFRPGMQHRVGRSPETVQPVGIPGQVGTPITIARPPIEIRTLQLQPHTEFGLQAVRNRNREVRPFSTTPDLYGLPDVQLRTRFLRPLGWDSFQSLTQEISFRLREVRPLAFSGTVGFHRVREFPEPPVLQYIEPNSIAAGEVERPTVRGNGIFPDGIAPGPFGTPSARGNTIQPQGWQSLEMADTRPDVISYQLILLGPTPGFPGAEERGIAPPVWDLTNAPRISPYTVWAPTGAPQQAKDNHPPGLEEPIGIRVGQQLIVGGVVPNPMVSNFLRSIAARPVNWDPNIQDVTNRFGTPAVTDTGNRLVQPQGFRGRWGFPFVLGGDLRMFPLAFETQEFGFASVEAPNVGPRTAAASGFVATAYGTAFVSRSPGEVLPFGWLAEDFGGIQSPFFTGLWVSNEYPPFPMPGFEATEWGDARVSRNPETLHPFGWDSFVSEADDIRDAMRVRARTRIWPLGIDLLTFGSASATPFSRSIGAYSVFSGAVSIPSVQPVARAQGIEPPTIDAPVVDQVEAGILKAKGDDSAAIGHAIVRAAINAPSLIGEVGLPAVFYRLAPSGWTGEFGSALVTGDAGHTCGMQARGARHVWTEAETFGDAEVANG